MKLMRLEVLVNETQRAKRCMYAHTACLEKCHRFNVE